MYYYYVYTHFFFFIHGKEKKLFVFNLFLSTLHPTSKINNILLYIPNELVTYVYTFLLEWLLNIVYCEFESQHFVRFLSIYYNNYIIKLMWYKTLRVLQSYKTQIHNKKFLILNTKIYSHK